MKNLFKKISLLAVITISIISFTATAMAVEADEKTPGSTGTAGATTGIPSNSVNESDLFYRFNYQGLKEGPGNVQTKIGAVSALPNKTWQEALAGVIKIMLNISGGLILIAMTVGGVFMITAGGKEEMTTKGKTIVVYSIVGIVIISVAYALVVGVSQLQIFQAGTAGNSSGGSSSGPAAPAPSNGPQGGGGVK